MAGSRSPLRRGSVALMALGLVLAACTSAGDEGAAPPESPTSPSPEASPEGRQAPEGEFDPGDIISGGPPPDGIPPIDDRHFLAPNDVRFLDGREPVLAVERAGEAKAYPLRIMIWHEIVNDEIGGQPTVVTYCPLCNTAIAFDRPTIDGELLDFGTSGKLYHSNLLMYDRQTESLWIQATGEAVVGPFTGRRLDFVAAQILSWEDWRAEHPDGLVLSTRTGADRPYGENPYGGYDRSGDPFLFSGDPDERLGATDRVLGLLEAGRALAVPYAEMETMAVHGWAVAHVRLGGSDVVVLWKAGTLSALDAERIPNSRDVGAIAAYDPRVGGRRLSFDVSGGQIRDRRTGSAWNISGRAVDGPLEGERLEPVVAIDSFWFDWAAFHPDTKVLDPTG